METNVENFRDKDILGYIESLPSFRGYPRGNFMIGVQSDEDAYNRFDDKIYAYTKNKTFLGVASATTNAGATGLKRYFYYNRKGVFVLKTNQWYYDMWKPGIHRGKMKALIQNTPVLHYRDGDLDDYVEELGEEYYGMHGINFHTTSYTRFAGFIKKWIGGWSTGCQVINDVEKYYKFLKWFYYQKTTTYVLVKERNLIEYKNRNKDE